MQYLQPSGRFATVGRGARKVLVFPPTVSTVALMLQAMPEELAALVKAWKKEPSMADAVALPGIVSTVVASAGSRIVPVIETFARFHDAPPWALREELAQTPEAAVPIITAMLGMLDVGRFYRDASLHKLDANEPAAGVISDPLDDPDPLTVMEKLTLRVAWKFGQPPHTVMDWPWESFMAAVRGLGLLNDDVPLSDLADKPTEYFTGDAMGAAVGIGYEKLEGGENG